MNLRVKLLLIFSIAAFTALGFFGYVAFDTAAQQSEQNETAALHEIFAQDIHQISDDLSHGQDLQLSLGKLKLNHLLSYVAFDKNHEPLYMPKTLSLLTPADLKRLPLTTDMGSFLINNTEFHWYTKVVPNSDITVAALYPHSQGKNTSFISQMAVTLVFTAFLVLWAAAWSAMYIASLFDKLNAQKAELEKMATHDALTGLPNRSLLNDRVEQAILRSNRDNCTFAVCFIDLNRFKEVNDTLGHLYGDQLLKEMSSRLAATVRASDTVSRLGGDEFAVVLNKVDREGAEIAAKKVVSAIEEAIVLKGNKYFLSASIGIAIFPKHGHDVQTIIKHADDAMYIAKKSGKNFLHYDDAAKAQEKVKKLDAFIHAKESNDDNMASVANLGNK